MRARGFGVAITGGFGGSDTQNDERERGKTEASVLIVRPSIWRATKQVAGGTKTHIPEKNGTRSPCRDCIPQF
jgi:hypothetical protein